MNNFQKNFRELLYKDSPSRSERGCIVANLAKSVGVQKRTVWAWLDGSTTPSLERFMQICESLSCLPNTLLMAASGENTAADDLEFFRVWLESCNQEQQKIVIQSIKNILTSYDELLAVSCSDKLRTKGTGTN